MIFQDYQEIEALTLHNTLSVHEQREVDVLDEIIRTNPADLQARMKKGFILFEAHMDGRAIQVFNEILELNPNYVDAYIWLVEYLLFHWADSENAIPLLEKAKEIAPERAEIYYLWACALQKRDDTSHFVEYMRKAIELEPSWISPRLCLIQYFADEQRTVEAKIELRELEKYLQADFPVPEDEMLFIVFSSIVV